MTLTARVNKPEYWYRPRQALRRLTQALLPQPVIVEVTLPWGLGIRVRTAEDHGRSIWRFGVYDLILSEAIWRLLDPGEMAVDVGANIGYVTGLMAARVGIQGKVMAFEPHPKVYAELVTNIAGWLNQPIAPTTPFALALSSKSGSAFLKEPADFDRNSGTARVVSAGPPHLSIAKARLDEVYSECRVIDLLKLDVEGHEIEVLAGSRRLLESGAVRDVIFEEHSRSFDSPVCSLLSAFGYKIFFLTRTLTGPLLVVDGHSYPTVPYLPPNFLATRKPERAVSRFRRRGWQVLQRWVRHSN